MPKKAKLSLPRGTTVPNHIAIIPDGNRRWARARGLTTKEGHNTGAQRMIELARTARDWGIHTVTLWGLSTENWRKRSPQEVDYLIKIFIKFIRSHLKDAQKEGVKIIHLGRKERLPEKLMKEIAKVEEKTKNNRKFVLNIALDYGGQDEIVRAVQKVIEDGVDPEKINIKLLDSYMDTANQPYPYPDLVIRTSGEQRTSGILLWQSHYAETYWERDHLPAFVPEKLRVAILDYSRRRRRYGGNDAMEHFKFKPEVAAKFEIAWWRLSKVPEGTRARDFIIEQLREQYGLSKKLAKEAAVLMTEAVLEGRKSKWEAAKRNLKKFYKIIKDDLKLAFEPSLVASLEIKLWKEMKGQESIEGADASEDVARELYAEVYRISLFQAAKIAHLRVLANIERNLAEKGFGEHHWDKAEDYLEKFYSALKERVA